jgi:hypothetical protein
VIAMQYEIPNQWAIKLSRAVYPELFNGRPLDEAVQHARKVLASQSSWRNRAFGTPVLYSTCGDVSLFKRPVAEGSAAKPLPPTETEDKRGVSAPPALTGIPVAAAGPNALRLHQLRSMPEREKGND